MDQTITVVNGEESAVYAERRVTATGRERINEASSLMAPEVLSIRHESIVAKGAGNPQGQSVDRHLVQLASTKLDSASEAPYTSTVNLTVAVPRSSHFSVADVERLFAIASTVLSENLEAILRGQS